MPRQYTAYEPDQRDCEVMVRALGQDFSLMPLIETMYTQEQVIVIVRCRRVADFDADKIACQALVKAPIRTARSLYSMQYSALLDCWHQSDRGVLGVADRPIERGWDGRPRQPRRST